MTNEKYDVIIGMEIHAELKTKSKMFCSCNNDSFTAKPNTNVCPVCLGHPGTLPVPNKQAIEWTILLGLSLDCHVNEISKLDRKNYFYPDLPKGYQISQYDLPLVYNGFLEIDGTKIAVTRVHIEEDTGKLIHPAGKNYSLVDLNRAGTPLIEMVTEPVITSAGQARKFCEAYQRILRYLEISNADMEKGEMRCEANISLQEKGRWEYDSSNLASGKSGEIKPLGDYKLNPKIEVKNINSFKAIEKAIEYEIKRQAKAIEEGERLIMETRGWDENKQATVHQRKKETSADYRYFPEPDIPPFEIDDEWIKRISEGLIELPGEKYKRFIDQFEFTEQDAELLVSDKYLADFSEKTISELEAWIKSADGEWNKDRKKLSKLTANWILSELFKHTKQDNIQINDIKITPENMAQLITLVYLQKINSSAGQQILEAMHKNGGDPAVIMRDLGLEQIEDESELESLVNKVINDNPDQVEQYKSGKEAILQFLVGKVMQASKGKANPKTAGELLIKLIK